MRCPLCPDGLFVSTGTAGRWECGKCRAILLSGRAETVVHVPAPGAPVRVSQGPPPAWAPLAPEAPAPALGPPRGRRKGGR